MADGSYAASGVSYDADQGAGGGGAGGKHRGPRFSWNPAFEATFFRSLCESVGLGLRDGSTFKQEAWDRATTALQDRHHAYANKGHLINKSDNARKKFRLWRGLREDPDFHYNPNTRMVTADEEAWRRHIEKEPLSRSLKGRPFDHEDFYEILFPDVIGSGGAPKRVTKQRRKGPDNLPGSDEQETPGTAIMDLIGDPIYTQPAAPRVPSTVSIPPTVLPVTVPPMRPQSTALPPRTSIASSSALTPPEENVPNTRKRFLPQDKSAATAAATAAAGTTASAATAPVPTQSSSNKRRRAAPHSHAPAPELLNSTSGSTPVPGPSHGDLTNTNANATAAASRSNTAAAPVATSTHPPAVASAAHDGLLLLAEALRAIRSTPKWPEKALDIFFRDFSNEDMDLQLKIAEKMLTDDNKAFVFCKMPVNLRKHWIKRLREANNNRPN